MSVLLAFAPLLALVVSIALGFYPGEELIARIGGRLTRPRRRSLPGVPRPRLLAGITGRSLLLAASRPSRGPPLPFASQ